MTFSGFVYEHLCFDLVLEPWPEQISGCEKTVRDRLPRLRGLLDECERAATADKNHKLIDMVNQVRAYLDLWDEVVKMRLERGSVSS